MLQLVAAEGYESITVRKLARLAGVSTASFYARFDGKDECFLNSCALVLDRIHGHVQTARSHRLDPRTQFTRTVEAFLAEPTTNPDAARVALVDAFGGGPAALGRIRDFEAALEAEVKINLSRRGATPSPTVTTWITAGYFQACRSLLAHGVRDQDELAGGLASWGMSHLTPAAASAGPARTAERATIDGAPSLVPSDFEERGAIIAAVTKLAINEGYWRLTAGSIRKQAGVSRNAFAVHFEGVEDCYLAAASELIRSYLSMVIAPAESSEGRAQSVQLGVAALTGRLAAEPEKAKFAFLGILDPGVAGLQLRERLIGEFAAKWLDAAPPTERRGPFSAETTIGAFWGVIARRIEAKTATSLPVESSTLTFLLLAPGMKSARRTDMKHPPSIS